MTVSHKAEAAPNDSLATDCPSKKILASQWFATLRGRICAELEQIETELTDTQNRLSPGKFERTAWKRKEGGGGEMSLMRGRVFEKAGVNISTVHGEFSESMRKEMPGADQDPRFWASGISVVVHPRSPLVPAVHMNTRFVIVGGESPESRVQSSEGRKEQGARQAGRACHQPAKRRSMESSGENSESTKNIIGGIKNMVSAFIGMPAISKAFEQIVMAKVAGSSDEARDMKILNAKSRVTMNRARLLADAKLLCLELAKNYAPPVSPVLALPGRAGQAALSMAVDGFVKSGKATAHDAVIARKLAYVLTGGNTDITEPVSEQRLLDLEHEAFMELIKTRPTLDRIEHMLNTGKPLRN